MISSAIRYYVHCATQQLVVRQLFRSQCDHTEEDKLRWWMENRLVIGERAKKRERVESNVFHLF